MKYELNFTAKMFFESDTPPVCTEEEMKKDLIELLFNESDANGVEVTDFNLMEIN